MTESLKELTKFVQLGTRLDLKAIALEHILGTTGTKEGLESLIEIPEILVALITLLGDSSKPISKDASLCLVNISADDNGASALFNVDVNQHCPPLQIPPNNIVQETLTNIFNPGSHIADQCSMILSNITRNSHLIDKVIEIIIKDEGTLDKLVDVFTKKHYNKLCTLHYLGPVFSNLSQSHIIRMFILDKKKNVIQKLLSFTEYKDSLIRRGGIIGTLKNCCFEEDYHEWLLSEEVNILPRLLLPLAGNEEFEDEENDKLPIDLQYLPEDKLREEDPDIRFILLEALTQLVAKRPNREYIRGKNAYVILRELHKWEKEKRNLLACEHLVNILIRTEDEIALENLKEVEVPIEIQEKLDKETKNL